MEVWAIAAPERSKLMTLKQRQRNLIMGNLVTRLSSIRNTVVSNLSDFLYENGNVAGVTAQSFSTPHSSYLPHVQRSTDSYQLNRQEADISFTYQCSMSALAIYHS
jgi:hypothetical protein